MDFVHEDLSLMSQEMDRWKALYKVKVRLGLSIFVPLRTPQGPKYVRHSNSSDLNAESEKTG